MSDRPAASKRSNAYEIFIFVLTILSLLVMFALVLPLSSQTDKLLRIYDNLICVVFLFDFFLNYSRSHPKRDYIIRRRGWLDLLGSIPSFGFFKYTALLRLARISRLARITRLLRGKHKRELIRDVLDHRGQYAAFITVLAAFVVLVLSSIFVLQFESKSPDANITTGGDALWWAVVTITTVGYGDKYPVTPGGRMTAVFVMFMGVGIIGSLASILASVLVPPAKSNGGSGETTDEAPATVAAEGTSSVAAARAGPAAAAVDAGDADPADAPPAEAPPAAREASLQRELAGIREELAGLRRLVATGRREGPAP